MDIKTALAYHFVACSMTSGAVIITQYIEASSLNKAAIVANRGQATEVALSSTLDFTLSVCRASLREALHDHAHAISQLCPRHLELQCWSLVLQLMTLGLRKALFASRMCQAGRLMNM
jgi:hypothetical protein